MKIVRTKAGQNNFRFEGLTLGSLLAIRSALKCTEDYNRLTPVGADVLRSLEGLDTVDSFGDSNQGAMTISRSQWNELVSYIKDESEVSSEDALDTIDSVEYDNQF
jgi:hypothetical protein